MATDPDARTEAAPLTGPLEEARQTVEEAPDKLAGRYELVGLLGAGAMGTVYRARDRELDEVVALKVLKKELASASDMLERRTIAESEWRRLAQAVGRIHRARDHIR